MEKLRKPGTRTSKSRFLCVLSIGILTLILGPSLLFFLFHNNRHNVEFPQRAGDRQSRGNVDKSTLHLLKIKTNSESDYRHNQTRQHDDDDDDADADHPRNSSAIGA